MTLPVGRKSVEPYLKDEVEFRDMQIAGVRILARSMRGAILADDMGLGKTLQMLATICTLFKMKKVQTALIVCPASIKGNWLDEFKKFTRIEPTVLGMDSDGRDVQASKVPVQLFRWNLAARENAAKYAASGADEDFKPSCLVVHYEQLSSKYLAKVFADFHYGVLVLDEAHLVKNPDSIRARHVLALKSDRTYSISGTPMPNHAGELWTHLARIDPKRFPDYQLFLNSYTRTVPGGGVRTANEGELKKALGPLMIRRRKSELPELGLEPPVIVEDMVEMGEQQRTLYDQIAIECTLDGQDVDNPLARFLRLQQVMSTPASLGMGYADHSAKLDRVVMRAEECARAGEKFVVFARFTETINCIQKRLSKIGTCDSIRLSSDVPINQRSSVVKRWAQAGEPVPLVCAIGVSGIGLNMTESCTLAIVDRLFVPGLNRQIIDRLHRIGQKKLVTAYIIMARNTVESRITAILQRKIGANKSLIEDTVDSSELSALLKEACAEEEKFRKNFIRPHSEATYVAR